VVASEQEGNQLHLTKHSSKGCWLLLEGV